MNATRLFPLVLLFLLPAGVFADNADSPRERISLDAGWRFFKGDAPEAGTNLNYKVIRNWILPTGNPFTTNAPVVRPEDPPATGISFASPDFDDSGWRVVNLPHDFGVEGAFDPALPGGTGKLPWSGVAWYRKALEIPESDKEQENILGRGRCDVLCDGVVERAVCGRLAVWLRLVECGPDAVSGFWWG